MSPSNQIVAAAEEAAPKKDGVARKRVAVACMAVASVFVLGAVIVLPSGMFTEIFGSISLAKIVEQITTNARDASYVLSGSGAAGMYSATVSRYFAAFVAGGALGVVGATFQGVFKNPLASPSTLGVISGGLFGAMAYYLFLRSDVLDVATISFSAIHQYYEGLSSLEYLWVVYGPSICALLGGLAVAGVALFVSRTVGSGALGNVMLVVVGQVFTLVLGTFTSTIRYYFEATGQVQRVTLVQEAQGTPFDLFLGLEDFAFFGIPTLVVVVVLIVLRNRITLLTLHDEEAQTMGVNPSRFRALVIVLCAAATGLVVGCVGPIAFVGFVCPHVARLLVGHDLRYLLPMSLFIGAIFLMVVLFVGTQFDIDMDMGLNLVSTIIGTVVFLLVAFRTKGGSHVW